MEQVLNPETYKNICSDEIINKNLACPNFHENLLWSFEKKECHECEFENYGFLCDLDSYFICYICSEYKILNTCPNNHDLKWTANKMCFNCNEYKHCFFCEKDKYSVCYKCYNYDFSQTNSPNKLEYKFFNFKSCFICKKKNKCLGNENDDFYLCLNNMNNEDDSIKDNICSVFRNVEKYKFKTLFCILGHKLKWKKSGNSCFKCENFHSEGLFCEICELYSHCIDCANFKFPIKDCPNNHGINNYKWINEKKKCMRCNKTHSGYYCNKCDYFICRINCVNQVLKKNIEKEIDSMSIKDFNKEIFLERIENSKNESIDYNSKLDESKYSFANSSKNKIFIENNFKSRKSSSIINSDDLDDNNFFDLKTEKETFNEIKNKDISLNHNNSIINKKDEFSNNLKLKQNFDIDEEKILIDNPETNINNNNNNLINESNMNNKVKIITTSKSLISKSKKNNLEILSPNKNSIKEEKLNITRRTTNKKIQTNYSIYKIRKLDEKYFLTLGKYNNIQIWNYLYGILIKSIVLNVDVSLIIFDSIQIINSNNLIILLINGSILIQRIDIETEAEKFELDLNPSFSMTKIDESNFIIGNNSFLSLWNYRGNLVQRKINNEKIKGKVFFIDIFKLKIDTDFIISCDESSIKLWDKSDISFVNEIEYPESNMLPNILRLMSIGEIFKVTKLDEENLIIFNNTLNIISLINLNKLKITNDSKTFEQKINKTKSKNINKNKLISSDGYANLIIYSEDKIVLYENKLPKEIENDKKNLKKNNIEDINCTVFLKKINELDMKNITINELKYLNGNSFVTLSSEFEVEFWDFKN